MAARAVELGGAVACFTQQYHARFRVPIEGGTESRIVDLRQRLGGAGDHLRHGRRRAHRRTPGRALCIAARIHVLVRRPAVLPDQRHETHVAEFARFEAVLAAARDLHQALAGGRLADRHHQAATDLQLAPQHIGHRGRAGGGEDRIVRRVLRPSAAAVASAKLDVRATQRGETPARLFRQRLVALDRIDLPGDARHDRRRVAGPGADFEHPVAGLQRRRVDHQRHDEGLGNRLPVFDRQRRILVGEFAELRRHELLARHRAHRFEHQRVADSAARDLALHHLRALGFGVLHGVRSGAQAGAAHWSAC